MVRSIKHPPTMVRWIKSHPRLPERTFTLILMVSGWCVLFAQETDPWSDCELKCMNGGSCAYVSDNPNALLLMIQRGELIQECTCPPEYGGVGCEIPLSLCNDTDAAEECARYIAYKVSSFAGQMYTNAFAEYCSQDLSSAVHSRFCLHGGKCSNTFQSNVFDESGSGCVCPSAFHGPHCEFLRLASSSSGIGGVDNTLDAGTAPTPAPQSGNRLPVSAGGITEGANETSDRVRGNEDKSIPSSSQTSPDSSDQSSTISILAGFGGAAIVAVLFVLYRSLCERKQKQTPDQFKASASRSVRIVKTGAPSASPAKTTSFRNTQTNRGCTSPQLAWLRGIQRSLKAWTSLPTRQDITGMTSVNRESARNNKNASPTIGDSSIMESASLSAPTCLEDDDAEIMIGTFDQMQQFAPSIGARQTVGRSAFEIPGISNRHRCTERLVQQTYRQRVSQLHSFHSSGLCPSYSGERDALDRETCRDVDELTQDSGHSSYTEQPASYFAHWNTPNRLYPRQHRMISPNELSLYSSGYDSGPAIEFTGATSSFSDYSSFPDSTTATSLRTWDLFSNSSSEGLSSTTSSSWSDGNDDESGSSLSSGRL